MTNVAQDQQKTRTQDLQQQLRDLQRDIAELEARAEGHLDHGRTHEAMALLDRIANLKRHSYEVEFDLLTWQPGFRALPKRHTSEAVTR